ncbi:hypothetical protein BCR33DRAFT_822466 [Rhizoclosmatium globosum]|uniref:C2H2-type domain-containing protein n=1 Tax=Rhizoclosmatium globosum TaxID=329046 RepID=A0A1Y2C601_9FUNG|nr:hypothetical protein BCR33DRAFT_822466 [Rhizoclosmatium globosum]|eukprot:ORY42459.1 hypothetical protein BCR33DRAFT_822466 [Rhizoclosmatium globosum]
MKQEVTYPCPHCPKEFRTLKKLSDHRRTHKPVFVCHECSSPFTAEKTLVSHYLDKHNIAKANIPFETRKSQEQTATAAQALALDVRPTLLPALLPAPPFASEGRPTPLPAPELPVPEPPVSEARQTLGSVFSPEIFAPLPAVLPPIYLPAPTPTPILPPIQVFSAHIQSPQQRHQSIQLHYAEIFQPNHDDMFFDFPHIVDEDGPGVIVAYERVKMSEEFLRQFKRNEFLR